MRALEEKSILADGVPDPRIIVKPNTPSSRIKSKNSAQAMDDPTSSLRVPYTCSYTNILLFRFPVCIVLMQPDRRDKSNLTYVKVLTRQIQFNSPRSDIC